MEKLGWDKTKYVTNNDVLAYLINKKTQLTNIVTPNTKFTYCNTNYALLALLIEKVTGEKYTAFLQKNVFVPLQMSNSFVFDTTMLNTVNSSYDWRNRIMPFNYLDAVYGDKNIYSTVQDLLKWDRAISSSNMFTKNTLDEAYTPYSNEKNGVRNYGLGWRMFVYPNGKKIIYHNGWWHGNNACFVRLIEDDATIIIMGNKFNRNIYHGRELANLFGNYTPVHGEEESETIKDSVTDNTTLTNKQLLLHAKQLAPKKYWLKIKK
jgi:CubicO group peptidase (beta-lactamase class C family)